MSWLEPVSQPTSDELFPATSHSPSLAELVGYKRAGEIIDFCFIANPYYPTPEMLEALTEHLPALIKSYPSSDPATPRRHLAQALGVDPDDLVIGNGATELIVLINDLLVERIGVPVPTFGEYIEKLRNPSAAVLYALRQDRDYQLDLAEYLAWARRQQLRALLVINPGNPTGQLLPLAGMLEFLEKARDLDLIVVDESFLEFAPGFDASVMPYAERFSNLVVVRSLSKNYGIPGLRLGFAYSKNHERLEKIRGLLPTWNLNILAEYLLTLLRATESDYQLSLDRIKADVRKMQVELSTVPGLHVYPTGTNFVLFRIEKAMTATELQARLLEDHGMYVRDCSNKVGLDDRHVRVASQGRQQDASLALALRGIMASTPDF